MAINAVTLQLSLHLGAFYLSIDSMMAFLKTILMVGLVLHGANALTISRSPSEDILDDGESLAGRTDLHPWPVQDNDAILVGGGPAGGTTLSPRSVQEYDVLVVGGGPAGLSAAMSLGRIGRSVLLIDSAVYREIGYTFYVYHAHHVAGNAATEHMHDVIGNDGTVPAAFRALVREEISQYPSVTLMNGTVESVT